MIKWYSDFRMTLKWKRTNKTETTNVPKQRNLIGLSNGYKRTRLLVGYANVWVKKLHARVLSRNQPILCFDIILQHDWPIKQCLLHIRVFFGRKTKSPCFDFFIHWLIKQNNNEHLPKPFLKVIRKSLWAITGS